MTLSSLVVRSDFAGDGSTTSFATGFIFWNSSDLRCILVSSSGGETVYTEGSEYSVTGGLGASGTVSVSSSVVPESGETFVVKSNVALLQGTDLPTGGQFNSDDVESEMDRMVRRLQQFDELFDRTPSLNEGSTYTNIALPNPSSGKVLAWSTDANLESLTVNSSAYLAVPIAVSDGGTGAVSASSARDSLGLTIGEDVQAYDADLATIAALTHSSSNPKAMVSDGSSWKAVSIGSSGYGLLSDGSSIVAAGLRKQGLETIWVPANAMIPRTTNGAASGLTESSTNSMVMIKTLDFDATTQEFAQFSVRFAKSYDDGAVQFAPQWTVASSSATGSVEWGLAGLALSDDDALSTAYGTAAVVADAFIAKYDIHIGGTSTGLTIGNTHVNGDWATFQVNRTVSGSSDTLAVDARLLGLTLLYTADASDDT